MAIVDDQIREYRRRSTALLDDANAIHAVLAIVEGLGADDTARQAAVDGFYLQFPDYDLPKADLFASVNRWRDMRTWLANSANFVPLNKTRI